MKPVVLVDLDGTLADTADESFKGMKDGLVNTDLQKIPLFDGAVEFVSQLKIFCDVFIVSDSHPKYVEKIVNEHFKVPCLCLADKPNTFKTQKFLENLGYSEISSNNLFVIGDTWLDIALGRGLNALTILVKLYKSKKIDERDGIGQDRKHWKSGPTFYAENYTKVVSIIENKSNFLFAGEAVFQGVTSHEIIKFHAKNNSDRFIFYRALARQQQGECDSFAVADKYFEFSRPDRSRLTLRNLSLAVENYINFVLSFKDYKWDYFTYVPDKVTTQPPNKMKDFFDKIDVKIEKNNLLEWSPLVSGSIRGKPNYKERLTFVDDNLNVVNDVNLQGKSIIILDDQLTTAATADAICKKFIDSGAKNLMFLALFVLTDKVDSQKICPKCGKKLQIKINKTIGNKFFSCVPPKFKGTGCGYIINISE